MESEAPDEVEKVSLTESSFFFCKNKGIVRNSETTAC